MSEPATLQKVLNVREQEKKVAQKEQMEARNQFEKVAEKLYVVLKTKEKAEEGLHQAMKSKATIIKIKEQSNYIEALNKKIVTLQHQVQRARQKMEHKQVKVTAAHVEVKKIEKLIEKREQTLRENERKMELIDMDEISIRQFMVQNQK